MTLQPTKKRPSSVHHKKRSGQHHKQNRHYLKSYWPYLPVLLVLGLGIVLNSWMASAHRSVLGYATEMSAPALLSGTNQQRASNGEAGLTENAKLDQAAQSKASDMAARDYWSHNTPDGQSPWTFITAAGYSYSTAGENLAYGFATSADTITGWMNSPGHRANILNASFTEVGFGIINIPNYQSSGPQTLVVAMYASPYVAPAPAPAPTTPKPAATTPIASAAPVTDTTTGSASGSDAGTPTDSKSDTLTPATNKPLSVSAEVKAPPSPEPKQQSLARVQLVSKGQLGVYSITLLSLALILAFAFRHVKAWHRVLVKGERFVLHHPGLDAAGAAILVACLLLGQSTGLIR